MRVITITPTERAELFRDDGATKPGGFQGLMRKLQQQVAPSTTPWHFDLRLYPDDLERIPRYAFAYHGGGWQQRLRAIFGRTLVHDLGRESAPTRPAAPGLEF